MLWHASASAPAFQRATALAFGAAQALLFAVSATYHVPRWSRRVKWLLSRADGAMIPVFITASFTPFAAFALDGVWRWVSLGVVWAIGAGGAVLGASTVHLTRRATALAAVGFGWVLAIPVVGIAISLPWPGTALIVVGGLLYSLGAVVYARRRPDPWPRAFGFHEVFHTLVVAAGLVHFVALLRYTVPIG